LAKKSSVFSGIWELTLKEGLHNDYSLLFGTYTPIFKIQFKQIQLALNIELNLQATSRSQNYIFPNSQFNYGVKQPGEGNQLLMDVNLIAKIQNGFVMDMMLPYYEVFKYFNNNKTHNKKVHFQEQAQIFHIQSHPLRKINLYSLFRYSGREIRYGIH
jgi:hypothetical protein